jgi:PPM family protein phosphatase
LTSFDASLRIVVMVKVETFSEIGGHLVNEDALAVEQHPSDPNCWLCCLADGQGGRAGGQQAASLAVRVAMDAVRRLPVRHLLSPAAWVSLLRQADATVEIAPDAGFTTLIGLGIVGDAVCGASSGDSKALATIPTRAQELTAQQFKDPPVGSGVAAFVTFSLALAKPWSVLVMSDGVWKYAGWDGVVDACKLLHGRSLVEALQQQARLRGSGRFQDDFSLVLREG